MLNPDEHSVSRAKVVILTPNTINAADREKTVETLKVALDHFMAAGREYDCDELELVVTEGEEEYYIVVNAVKHVDQPEVTPEGNPETELVGHDGEDSNG